jgi:hypothetical protein
MRRVYGRAGALPNRSGRHPVCSVPAVFARRPAENSCEQRQRNRRTSARLMARGKHPVGVQMSHFWGVWRLGQSCPQVRVAATIAFSPEWVKADRRRSTMPDRGHSPGLGRRHGRTQAIHQPQPGDGVALLQSY